MSKAVAWFASHYALWVGKLVVKSDKRLAVGVIAIDLGICHSIVSIVVAALLVFGLMIDDAAIDLHFAC